MALVQAGDVKLNIVESGDPDGTPVVFVHGNLGCLEWLDLAREHLPPTLRVIAYDWRGAGGSDKPEPEPGYANYRMETHARDLLALLDALGIDRCHVINHSTGGIITTHALRAAPARFHRVVALDPVGPGGLALARVIESGLFGAMKADRNVAFAGLASAAPTLFDPASLAPGKMPVYAAATTAPQRALFETVVDRMSVLSDGIWHGVAHHLDAASRDDQGLSAACEGMSHPHLLIRGHEDAWIPREDILRFAALLPNAIVHEVPGIGHSMNIEDPRGFARLVRAFLL